MVDAFTDIHKCIARSSKSTSDVRIMPHDLASIGDPPPGNDRIRLKVDHFIGSLMAHLALDRVQRHKRFYIQCRVGLKC